MHGADAHKARFTHGGGMLKFYIKLREKKVELGIISGTVLVFSLEGAFFLVQYILTKEFPGVSTGNISTLTAVILIGGFLLYLCIMEIIFRLSKKD